MGFSYHSKLLKIFTTQQLDQLMEHSIGSMDDEDRVIVIFSFMDFGCFEIYCDCDAEYLDCAIISVCDDENEDESGRMNSDDFWAKYTKNNPEDSECINVDL
jgi:hypothetical protein